METHWIVGGLIVVFKGLLVVFMVGMGFYLSFGVFFLVGCTSGSAWHELWEDEGRHLHLTVEKSWKDLTWRNIFEDIFVNIFIMPFFLIGIPLLVLYGLGMILVATINNVLAGPLGVRSLGSGGLLIGFCLFLTSILFDWPMNMSGPWSD